MSIAIVGAGAIGSTFAFHLARHGHNVTVVARGQRLGQLQTDQAVVTVEGEQAAVQVAAALDPAQAYDLVLVTVLAPQVEAVLPALRASAAKIVMFMFNTFEPLEPLRAAVGAERFAFGFPGIIASLTEGKLKFKVYTSGQTTLATDAGWAKTFTEAGILTVVPDDMESWLRTHAALIASLMALSTKVVTRGSAVSWAEAGTFARATKEGFALVRQLGNKVTPRAMAFLSRLPTGLLAGVFWGLSRTKGVRAIGTNPTEPRALIDMMSAVAPGSTAALRSIRP